jgi:hypothetical protein
VTGAVVAAGAETLGMFGIVGSVGREILEIATRPPPSPPALAASWFCAFASAAMAL